jgi:hypothetical protein
MLPTHFSCSPDRRARALTAWLAIVVSCVLHFSSVSAQSRLNYEADHVIRCGYPEDGIIIVNSGLNETYLIPPPPSLPKRLALPEGSRVINSRPLDDHSGEIGYQLRALLCALDTSVVFARSPGQELTHVCVLGYFQVVTECSCWNMQMVPGP